MLKLINLSVRGQELNGGYTVVASHTIRKIFCKFDLICGWDYSTIKAVFFNKKSGVKKDVLLDENNECEVAWECMTDVGDVYVNLVAGFINPETEKLVEQMTSFKTKIVTVAQKVNVDATASMPPTPEIWEQIVARLQSEIDEKIDDAPKDGNDYLRNNGAWKKLERGQTDTYVYEQQEASNTWEIEHNLNKYPSVTIVDSANSTVVGGVEYVNKNKIIISFNGAFSGYAYLN